MWINTTMINKKSISHIDNRSLVYRVGIYNIVCILQIFFSISPNSQANKLVEDIFDSYTSQSRRNVCKSQYLFSSTFHYTRGIHALYSYEAGKYSLAPAGQKRSLI